MSKQFFVHTSGIRNQAGSKLPIDVHGTMTELVVSGSQVADDADVVMTGQVLAMEAAEGVTVQGVVSAPWHGECRRCLGPATGTVQAEVKEIFEPSPVDGETYPLQPDGLDLELLIRESVMLDLPEAPVCKEDCRGLCPTCGVNWNDTECTCANASVDLRWAALDQLRLDN